MKSLNQRLIELMDTILNQKTPMPIGIVLDAARLERDLQQPENLHVFRVVYIPQTSALPTRVRVYSERFKQVITLSWHDDKFDQCRDAQERAVIELKERGYNIVSIGSGNACMYVMSDTFKPLKGE